MGLDGHISKRVAAACKRVLAQISSGLLASWFEHLAGVHAHVEGCAHPGWKVDTEETEESVP